MAKQNRKWLTTLQRERLGPWVLGVVSTVAVELMRRHHWIVLPGSDEATYFSAVISLGGVLVGFMATIKTLLYGMSDDTLKRLHESGYYNDLVGYLRDATWGSLFMCIVPLTGFFVQFQDGLNSLLVGVIAFALASIGRVLRVATLLLAIKRS